MAELRKILELIAPHNNAYRDRGASVRDKLAAMWEIGDVLVKAGVTSAHSFGWEIQRETRGLVKRPTIFRSHKFRVVWSDKDQFLRTFGGIRGLSSLVDMLPLLDPAQRGNHHVPAKIVEDLTRQMHLLPPGEFKSKLDAIKKKYADATLGKTYNRGKHLAALRSLAQSFRTIYTRIRMAVMREDPPSLAAIRSEIPSNELHLFSSMCLALTTMDNRRLCSKLPANDSTAKDPAFGRAYDGAANLLRETPDVRRASFRKLVAADALADLADLCNSVVTDDGVQAYKLRARVTIAL